MPMAKNEIDRNFLSASDLLSPLIFLNFRHRSASFWRHRTLCFKAPTWHFQALSFLLNKSYDVNLRTK